MTLSPPIPREHSVAALIADDQVSYSRSRVHLGDWYGFCGAIPIEVPGEVILPVSGSAEKRQLRSANRSGSARSWLLRGTILSSTTSWHSRRCTRSYLSSSREMYAGAAVYTGEA